MGHMGRITSTFYRLWRNVVRIFPEVVDVGVGVGYDLRGLGDAHQQAYDVVDDGDKDTAEDEPEYVAD